MQRRQFLQLLTMGSAALALESHSVGLSLAQTGAALQPKPRTTAAHLLNRITFGITPDLYEEIERIGVDAYLEQQLHPENIDDSALDAALERYPILKMSSAEIIEKYVEERQEVVQQLIGATLARAMLSKRTLYEMMVHFWTDHFNIYIGKQASLLLKPVDDRDVIRPHAMGNFRDLLHASAKSPAMLFYLDNAQSTREAPNENYARELMELHTLGVNGGYTEEDVKAVARAFTGWSIVPLRGRKAESEDEVGTFIFRIFAHDERPVTVLGQTIDGYGMRAGEQVLDLLAAHPSTAQFISTKLVRRFVADEPPASLVAHCAQTFMETNGDIRSVLRTLFTSEEFRNAAPKLKRPLEYFMSVLRGLDYQVMNEQAFERNLRGVLDGLGQVPFTWAAPNGFPDVSEYWLQNLLPRWNLAVNASMPNRGGQPNYERLLGLANQHSEDPLIFFAHYFLGRDFTADEQQVIQSFYEQLTLPEDNKGIIVVALLLASPAFQYR